MSTKNTKTAKIVIVSALIVCAIVAGALLVTQVIIPNSKYNDAVALMETGDVISAYEALIAMDGYKDSAEKANSIYDEYKMEKLKNAIVGDYVTFGSYEQDNDTSNGAEEIEWLVLEKTDDKILVISKYVLDCKPYDSKNPTNTWEYSTLRKWLNRYFIDAAFTIREKKLIPTVTVSTDNNPEYSTFPSDTQDRVFLLSITEANKYFNSDGARQCKATDYACANGVASEVRIGDGYLIDYSYVKCDGSTCLWLLRSPGYDRVHVATVEDYGGVYENGYYVYIDHYGVRPAMWINLDF